MGRGATRVSERIASSFKIIEGASIKFSDNKDIKFGGVMLALPALLSNGLLNQSEKVFKIKQGYYHLSNIFILLAFCALLRIKTIEEIKNYSPGEFGKILGLDRIPEIRTIRSKLNYIAKQNKSSEFSSLLSKQWLEGSNEAAGILYVDGHTRIYTGSQTKLPKHYISRQRLCMPGIADYWVNDILGQPFFYVSSELNIGMINILKNEIIPRLLKEVPNQPSEEELEKNPALCRFTMVFDREGSSHNFFGKLWEQRIAVITYKKNVKDEWPVEEFKEYKEIIPCGETVSMKLAEKKFILNDMEFREIRKLTESNHQTAIITTNRQINTGRIAIYMFARWSQENFFKYMTKNYGIDLLCEYGIEDIPDTKKIANPEYNELSKQIKISCGHKTKLSVKFTNCIIDSEKSDEQNTEKMILKKSLLKEKIDEIDIKITELKNKRKTIPRHIKINDLPEHYKFKGLLHKKKHIIDLIKMIAYRSEVALASILKEYRPKDDAIKSFICSLFENEIDIFSDEKKKKLIISLHNLNNESSDSAARYLCEKLNDTNCTFPGTDLCLFFKMVSDSFP